MLRAVLCHAELLQQFQRDAFHNEASRWLVNEPIEIRQSDRGDDAIGEARAFDEQSLHAIARGGESSRDPSAAAAADEHVSLDNFHGVGMIRFCEENVVSGSFSWQ